MAQFARMVQHDGGSLRLLGTEGGVIRVGYAVGVDPSCEDGACILPEVELQQMMAETLSRRDPNLAVQVTRL